MKTNAELQKDVQVAIGSVGAILNSSEIGVTAKNGIVTLTGTVDSLLKKAQIENAAKNVAGVVAITENIEINNCRNKACDDALVVSVLHTLEKNSKVQHELLKVRAENSWVTLSGQIKSIAEKETAKEIVSGLKGVKGISNNICIKPETEGTAEQKEIETALARNWSIHDDGIRVRVTGSLATLTGCVNSLYEKDEASRMAWNADGINKVTNELIIYT